MSPHAVDAFRPFRALGWAAFLACSWTWCIGMFLPALLAADFGPASWFVFAIPNILGAMGLGLALRAPGAAAAHRASHRAAGLVFSSVTIAFHAFFVSFAASHWLTVDPVAFTPGTPAVIRWTGAAVNAVFSDPARAGVVIAQAVFAAGLIASFGDSASWRRMAITFWTLSALLVFGGAAIAVGLAPPAEPILPPSPGVSPPSGLLFAAAALGLGFATCPWLDLTFLRARAEAPGKTGDAAFVLGFGVLFAALVAGTMLYARDIVLYMDVPRLVAAHFILQSIFTVGAHLREIRLANRPLAPQAAAPARPAPSVVLLALALLPLGASFLPPFLRADLLTIPAYWAFLGCYGAAFPAYVWIVVAERRWSAGASRNVRIAVATLAALAAFPCYWLAFVEKQWLWAGLGAAILAAAPLALAFAPRTPRPAPQTP